MFVTVLPFLLLSDLCISLCVGMICLSFLHAVMCCVVCCCLFVVWCCSLLFLVCVVVFDWYVVCVVCFWLLCVGLFL